jgi:hypothetical protein
LYPLEPCERGILLTKVGFHEVVANYKYQTTACVCKETTGDSGRGKELAGTNKKGYR